MISKGNHVKFVRFGFPAVSNCCDNFFFHSMYNKTIIRFGFCDIQNNQGLGKDYQPQPSTLADNPYLDYSGYHKKPHPIIVYKQMLKTSLANDDSFQALIKYRSITNLH